MNNSPPKPKGGFWQSFYRVLQLVVIGYLLIVVAALIFQRRLIYIPTRLTTEAALHEAAEHGFTPWKNGSGQIIGWKMAAGGTATGSVLIVHGNAGCALDRDYLAQPIHDAADVDVYVLEYPGYGARGGSPGKSSFFAAAEEAFELLPADKSKYVVSESLGTGVAAELAEKHPSEVAGLAMFAPYHNLAMVAQKQMPFLPAYFLLMDRFNPADSLKDYHGPVEFIVAGSDEIISPGFGRKLFAGYNGPKEMQVIAGAHHNEIAGQPPSWWREVFSFWRLHSERQSHESKREAT
ncbi:MAG TPA: alpha/beta hydrolase [Candidatus Binatia bacterium]|nr:alpha/beta hydrolase [Candidatus Binatia bacterium]